jgi:hypothetical protein
MGHGISRILSTPIVTLLTQAERLRSSSWFISHLRMSRTIVPAQSGTVLE